MIIDKIKRFKRIESSGAARWATVLPNLNSFGHISVASFGTKVDYADSFDRNTH